jgi:hypothetical protein
MFPLLMCVYIYTSHSQSEHDKKGFKIQDKNTEFRTMSCDCGLTVPGSSKNSASHTHQKEFLLRTLFFCQVR